VVTLFKIFVAFFFCLQWSTPFEYLKVIPDSNYQNVVFDSARLVRMKSQMHSPMISDTLTTGKWVGMWHDLNVNAFRYTGSLDVNVLSNKVNGTLVLTKPGQHGEDSVMGTVTGNIRGDSIFVNFMYSTFSGKNRLIKMSGACVKQIRYVREIVGDSAVVDVPYLVRTAYGTYDEPQQYKFFKGFFQLVLGPIKLPYE
jgi:hypothetical protein